jgi:hypothetical protein
MIKKVKKNNISELNFINEDRNEYENFENFVHEDSDDLLNEEYKK